MFEVYNTNGDVVVDDKSFPFKGTVVTLTAGEHAIDRNMFKIIGVYGRDLRRGVAFYRSGQGEVSLFGANMAVDVVMFSDQPNASAPVSTYGIEIINDSGAITFSSNDNHFIFHSQSNLNYNNSEVLQDNLIYCMSFYGVEMLPAQMGQMEATSVNVPTVYATGGRLTIGRRVLGLIPHTFSYDNPTPLVTLIRLKGKGLP